MAQSIRALTPVMCQVEAHRFEFWHLPVSFLSVPMTKNTDKKNVSANSDKIQFAVDSRLGALDLQRPIFTDRSREKGYKNEYVNKLNKVKFFKLLFSILLRKY